MHSNNRDGQGLPNYNSKRCTKVTKMNFLFMHSSYFHEHEWLGKTLFCR